VGRMFSSRKRDRERGRYLSTWKKKSAVRVRFSRRVRRRCQRVGAKGRKEEQNFVDRFEIGVTNGSSGLFASKAAVPRTAV